MQSMRRTVQYMFVDYLGHKSGTDTESEQLLPGSKKLRPSVVVACRNVATCRNVDITACANRAVMSPATLLMASIGMPKRRRRHYVLHYVVCRIVAITFQPKLDPF